MPSRGVPHHRRAKTARPASYELTSTARPAGSMATADGSRGNAAVADSEEWVERPGRTRRGSGCRAESRPPHLRPKPDAFECRPAASARIPVGERVAAAVGSHPAAARTPDAPKVSPGTRTVRTTRPTRATSPKRSASRPPAPAPPSRPVRALRRCAEWGLRPVVAAGTGHGRAVASSGAAVVGIRPCALPEGVRDERDEEANGDVRHGRTVLTVRPPGRDLGDSSTVPPLRLAEPRRRITCVRGGRWRDYVLRNPAAQAA